MNTIQRKLANGFDSRRVVESNTVNFLKYTNIVLKLVVYAVRMIQTTPLQPPMVPVRIVNGWQRSKLERIRGVENAKTTHW